MLRLPDGIETIGNNWFVGAEMEKLVVPSSVRSLGAGAFSCCDNLREVVFLFDYKQGHIRNFRYRLTEPGEDASKGIRCIQT